MRENERERPDDVLYARIRDSEGKGREWRDVWR
jgi:hypothetical protein